MTKSELQKKIALLESLNDHLHTELSYVDHLMKIIGFSSGIQSLKITAELIMQQGSKEKSFNSLD